MSPRMSLRDDPNFAWLFEENPDYVEGGIVAPTPGLPPPGPGEVRTTPVTPTISAPVVPTVTQVQPVYTPAPTAPPPGPGEVRTTPVTGVTSPATSITTTPVQGVATAPTPETRQTGIQQGAGKQRRLLRSGAFVDATDEEWQGLLDWQNAQDEANAKERAAADDARRRGVEAEEARVKISEMLAAGQLAYQQALIAGADADRAQRAAQAAMEQNYRMQLLAIQQQIQGQKLSIEQRQMQEERRRRRPFAPRPAVSVS